ncbi:SDR family oxidoreductase [Roseateles terrae]|uniref:NAD(P)-dependent dehydrogenase (Short-subunit alcohol dehydrogenase family) n=1 Tax=Roseateles terrae TaxID=431060 RepID=A0ABR6GU05_9BURK|nr:SDR family oxidoreductase [Roseateles terrae]MBB3195576.1 NAD(P)-dependent dehydrogenase (short-subunit alcohol dehydrogenase family) [Roseateles terrae]OWQ86487.1 short chain dehydrogenase [Roseateles terrae]
MTQVLIIGASRGIGLELVRQHRASGDQVVATARDEESLQRLRALGATAIKLDVSDVASIAGLAWQLDGFQFNRVMYVAGLYGPRTIGLQPPSQADFDAVMHTNVLGPMRVLPQLLDALAPDARIGILSSRMGSMTLRANSAGWVYRASKAAANSVMKDMALALEGRALCVSLHPGWVKTDMGGQEADIDVATSAASLRQVLDGLTAADNGAFFNYDGKPLPW